ncbi:MAG: prepilin-type N-terminal cleavage/methylation domain-containing protein [Bifidobacteriaceae bacterium]|jgi:prepilin-type N-terminal cleavage/methylation domain-containing protein|nr:prepilin-type N-terminal cleavage/methylation domain-containing protein [Bifidobacteriaceae bacterium]
MMDRIWRSQREQDQGFSLVELLIVIIIIGILAAIAIPLFLSQRQKAFDASVKTDVETLGKEMATWFVDNETPPAAIAITGQTYTFDGAKVSNRSPGVVNGSDGSNTVISLTGSDGTGTAGRDDWCVSLRHPNGTATGNTWSYNTAAGLLHGACA